MCQHLDLEDVAPRPHEFAPCTPWIPIEQGKVMTEAYEWSYGGLVISWGATHIASIGNTWCGSTQPEFKCGILGGWFFFLERGGGFWVEFWFFWNFFFFFFGRGCMTKGHDGDTNYATSKARHEEFGHEQGTMVSLASMLSTMPWGVVQPLSTMTPCMAMAHRWACLTWLEGPDGLAHTSANIATQDNELRGGLASRKLQTCGQREDLAHELPRDTSNEWFMHGLPKQRK